MKGDGLDTCLALVADGRRRTLLEYLRRDADGAVRIDTVVEDLYGADPLAGEDRPPSRERLAVLLFHYLLPRLAAHGVVEYDPEAGTVAYRADEQVEAVLDVLPEEPSSTDAGT